MKRLPLYINLMTSKENLRFLQPRVAKNWNKRQNKGNETLKVKKAAYTQKDFEKLLE